MLLVVGPLYCPSFMSKINRAEKLAVTFELGHNFNVYYNFISTLLYMMHNKLLQAGK